MVIIMKILITGICGFVGSSLAVSLLEDDPGTIIYGMENFVRPGSDINRIKLQGMGIQVYYGDIRSASDFDVLPPADWVIDAAAMPSVLAGTDGNMSSRQLIEHNLQGTINILEYCKRHRSGFILLSTSRVYSIPLLASLPIVPVDKRFELSDEEGLPPGVSPEGVSEQFSTTPPISLYGCTKLTSELLALEYGETFDFPVWINRCGVMAGAGQFGRADQGIFSYWIHAYHGRQHLAYIGFEGSGYQVRDCFHPRDLVMLLKKQFYTADMLPRIVNLGGGRDNSMSLAELSSWCKERFGAQTVARDTRGRRFDIPWMIMDSSLANKVWEWKPVIKLEEILEEIALHAEANRDWLKVTGGI